MCGIVGYWDNRSQDATVIEQMVARIQHRGPDDTGVWINKEKTLAFGHNRLSILDLSEAGHQPMVSPCGRYVLTYNGEIYNHLDLRIELEHEGGHFEWRGHSDTETLLAALRHWGVKKALQRLNGMFAFALWDKTDRCIYLARDRMGEKPLYYGLSGDCFMFGSELKSLVAHPDWNGKIDRNAMTLYLRHSYVPAPLSIYQGIKKLPQGHFVVVQSAGSTISEPHCYWSPHQQDDEGLVTSDISKTEYIDELDILLRKSVKSRMASDVPLGAFLSGGIDSSTVVALMQAQSSSPVKTFSIGFHEQGYNEAADAKKVAENLGTDHTDLYVSPEDAMAVIPQLPAIWDEPFSDSSQIPTYLVSQLASNHVTVSLTGDGGDELFCGYTRYTQGYQAWQKLQLLPRPLRRAMGQLAKVAPSLLPKVAIHQLSNLLRTPHLSQRLTKFANVASADSTRAYYKTLVSHWENPSSIVIGGEEPPTTINSTKNLPSAANPIEMMMHMDTCTYLPDDILTKVDRASMSVSLEARVPFLDHRVVEFAYRTPLSLKYRNGKGKWLLREVLCRYLPRELFERPKMGFGVPIDRWLCGPLREWAEELLDEKRMQDEGYFNPLPIRKMWREHLGGKRLWHHHLWGVLMFQAWLERNP